MNEQMPTLNEMLKLYSKKDLWDRIQEKNQIIKGKDQLIAELQKQLKNAENLAYELQTKLNLREYEPVFCNLAGRNCNYLGQIEELKQQLEEKEQRISELGCLLKESGYSRRVEDEIKIKAQREELEAKEKTISKYKAKVHTQPREIVEKVKSKMDNIVDVLINLGNCKEDAVAWFLGILQEVQREYEEKTK